jgi:XTP/dITP diphosphohydrolase
MSAAAPWAIATGNAGKVREVEAALAGLGLVLTPASSLDLGPFPDESGATYDENALLKACFVAAESGLVALADDSGLEVDALGGEPGVHSARYGGDGLSDRERIAHLLRQLRHVPDARRTARFVSVVALAHPGGEVVTFRGVCAGTILQGPRGRGGFGYDPVFRSGDLGVTFGEASLAEKERVSHRGRALAALRTWLGSPAAAPFRAGR